VLDWTDWSGLLFWQYTTRGSIGSEEVRCVGYNLSINTNKQVATFSVKHIEGVV
jgi:hypothetical protein